MKFKKFISYFLVFSFFVPVGLFKASAEKINSSKNELVLKKNIKPKKQIEKSLTKEMDELPAKACILTDYKTGQVLYEKNADKPLAIASLTKIMTMLLVVEAVEEKKISLKDMVAATKNAKPSVEEASLWLKVGEKMSVSDLLKAVAVNSCNDASRILAEYVAKSEKEFVKLMNKRAKELKLKNTNFVNASGLDAKNHYSSARDVATMAKELLKHEWILKYTSIIKETLLKGKKKEKFMLNNTNLLLQTYKGCNGLKTGTEEKAGKCLCATAIKNNMTLCAVCLGSKKTEERFQTCASLLDYGFNNFKPIKISGSSSKKE